jgi:hypothetical protein
MATHPIATTLDPVDPTVRTEARELAASTDYAKTVSYRSAACPVAGTTASVCRTSST